MPRLLFVVAVGVFQPCPGPASVNGRTVPAAGETVGAQFVDRASRLRACNCPGPMGAWRSERPGDLRRRLRRDRAEMPPTDRRLASDTVFAATQEAELAARRWQVRAARPRAAWGTPAAWRSTTKAAPRHPRPAAADLHDPRRRGQTPPRSARPGILQPGGPDQSVSTGRRRLPTARASAWEGCRAMTAPGCGRCGNGRGGAGSMTRFKIASAARPACADESAPVRPASAGCGERVWLRAWQLRKRRRGCCVA